MKRTILKDVGIGLCFLLSTGTIYAQNYPRKVKIFLRGYVCIF